MFSTGCISLMVAGMVACYSGNHDGVKLTCSDAPIAGLETCKQQAQRMGLSTSTTGTIITILPPRP